MRTPGYERDLDLVAAAPDGRFGAYCVCWMDPANGVGEFEPVGAPGLSRAGVGEGGGVGRLPTHESPRRAHTALVRFEGDMPRPAFVRLVGCDVRSTTSSWPALDLREGAREEGRARVVWWAAMVPCATSSVSVRLEEEA
jgi:hypothetical protein